MKSLDKHDVIIHKVNQLKKSEFKATAIKVELEAQFNRRDTPSSYCDYCTEGRRDCSYCEGYWENQECSNCDGSAEVLDENRLEERDENGGRIYVECEQCDGNGSYNCDECDRGRVDCDECDQSERQPETHNWRSEEVCQDWIMEKLSHLGLAEYRPDEAPIQLSHGHYSKWHPIGALKYGEFYRDGSVDSEFTFTLSVENSDSVFLLPQIIEIWNQMGEAIGNGVDLSRAGMHMALINHSECRYPVSSSSANDRRFENFQRSMSLLLPALFFLGSGNEKSRELRFRQPRVANRYSDWDDSKYSAVYYNGGAVEFRVFNTCYDQPEQILDNLVVMANCMRYWTSVYRPSGLSKITKSVRFGNNNDDSLQRFYCTVQHVDLLNGGLAKLKPAYYSIRQVKQQRKFGVTKRVLNKLVDQRRKEAEIEYQEYEERFTWQMLVQKNRYVADRIENAAFYSARNARPSISDADRIQREAEIEAERLVEADKQRKTPMADYIKQKLERLNEDSGRYTLAEEN